MSQKAPSEVTRPLSMRRPRGACRPEGGNRRLVLAPELPILSDRALVRLALIEHRFDPCAAFKSNCRHPALYPLRKDDFYYKQSFPKQLIRTQGKPALLTSVSNR